MNKYFSIKSVNVMYKKEYYGNTTKSGSTSYSLLLNSLLCLKTNPTVLLSKMYFILVLKNPLACGTNLGYYTRKGLSLLSPFEI